MEISETIRRLRREKGLTQEQVAQALGITATAVNKWERGASCPDLALLSPLARLLDTDLNGLLSFRAQPEGAEIARMTEELCQLGRAEGMAAAFAWAEEKWRRWPGCDSLTISLAMALNGLLFTLGVEEPEPWEETLEAVLAPLADSADRDVRDQALHLLFGRAMGRAEYGRAEELLAGISDRWPYRETLRAGLLRHTGRAEQAAQLWEHRLLNAATECYEALVSLQELALQAGEGDRGKRLGELAERTAAAFALPGGTGPAGPLQQAAAEGDRAAALAALRALLEGLGRPWDGDGLYPHLAPEPVNVGEALLPGMARALLTDPTLAFLRDDPEFGALLAELEPEGTAAE